MKMFYITVAVFIMWLLIFHLCPRSTKKIEFFIGNLSFAFPFTNHEHNAKRNYIKIGEIIPNCGIERPCPENHFSIHVHTGRSISDQPKICVSGKYVIHDNLKNWARGFNIVLVDPRRQDSVAVVSFGNNVDWKEVEDFFSKEVQDDDIVIAMTFDEAIAKLMNGFRKLFIDLGSGLIQNLQSRDQWYMVSQKGLEGFAPYEELLPFQRGRLDSLDRKFCIPTKIIGQAIVPDPMIQSNFKRKAFCQKYSQVQEFCSPRHILSELRPGFLLNPMMMGNPFYHSPILVLALQSLSHLSLTLETLITQPGIQLKNVMVVYNPTVMEGVPELCALFGMRSVKTGALKYWEIMHAGFEGLVKEHQESFYVTVLEEGVLLSPDYFSFISKTSQLLQDPSVLGVSAWNPNGAGKGGSSLNWTRKSLSLTFLDVSTFQTWKRPEQMFRHPL